MATQPAYLKFFADYIEQQIGIVYSESNYFQLEHRLSDIITLLGFKDMDELWKKAQTGIHGQFRDLLLDVATNNETSFFRDPSIFQALTQNLIPDLGLGKNSVKIWSAAGSSGQEAYSIAMSLEQAKLASAQFPDYQIQVSDISERILKRSEEGVYSQLEVQRGLPARLLIEYFEKVGEASWRVKPRLRERMSFRKLNLLEPFPTGLGPFDIIFCRNVLIYQSVENKVQVLERLYQKLNPGGFLVLGAAETLLGLSKSFKQVQFGTAVAYKK